MPNVILVEDDEATAYVLTQRLTAAGASVDWFRDPYDAIDSLGQKRYDAAIVDLVLMRAPGGFTVLTYIEMERPELVSRTFLVTGMSPQTILNTARSYLPRTFHKPADDRLIANAVMEAVADRSADAVTRRILLVDDDDAYAAFVQQLARRAGVEADVASDGAEAIRRLATATYERILLDVVMPRADGVTVLDWMAGQRPDLIGRVTIVTALDGRFLERVREFPVAGILDKSCEPSQLAELIGSKAPGALAGSPLEKF